MRANAAGSLVYFERVSKSISTNDMLILLIISAGVGPGNVRGTEEKGAEVSLSCNSGGEASATSTGCESRSTKKIVLTKDG